MGEALPLTDWKRCSESSQGWRRGGGEGGGGEMRTCACVLIPHASPRTLVVGRGGTPGGV
jgi:hypothetical protein